MNAPLVSIVLLLLTTASVRCEEKISEFAKAFGKDFERNTALLAHSFGGARDTPLRLLREPNVLEALGVSTNQRTELASLLEDDPNPGIDLPENFANLTKDGVKSFGQSLVRAGNAKRRAREKQAKSILTDKQYRRLEELHLQHTLLFGNRFQVPVLLDLEKSDVAELNALFAEADREIEIEMRKNQVPKVPGENQTKYWQRQDEGCVREALLRGV